MQKNSFFNQKELSDIGFKKVGANVLISRKASIYSPEIISIGDNVRIDDFCILSGKIEIHNYIHIASYSCLYGGSDGIVLFDYSNISSRVCIYAKTDDYSGQSMTNPMIPNKYKNVISAPVIIKKHVIIGSTSVVMPGVTLEEGSAFGAFSFITKDSLPWSINIGIPAKRIKDRERDILRIENKFIDRGQKDE